ncbi:hypothetical protein L3Q82_001452 [Scortum barcoo]|uniref:Uncharacterized protein n=1 Tax=Scortum barcoo TaxID=214431 RepID=A0ACB8W7R6_9TELE|nr:hypothetical protein L3Q82_001452 [Scortum barcoo]
MNFKNVKESIAGYYQLLRNCLGLGAAQASAWWPGPMVACNGGMSLNPIPGPKLWQYTCTLPGGKEPELVQEESYRAMLACGTPDTVDGYRQYSANTVYSAGGELFASSSVAIHHSILWGVLREYLGALFMSEGKMEREIDMRIGAASAVMRSVYRRTVVVKKELSRKAKLSIYWQFDDQVTLTGDIDFDQSTELRQLLFNETCLPYENNKIHHRIPLHI